MPNYVPFKLSLSNLTVQMQSMPFQRSGKISLPRYTIFCIKIKKLDSISKGGIFQGIFSPFLHFTTLPCYSPVSRIPHCIISRFLQCKGRLASCSRSPAVFLIAVKNAAGATALARACVVAYLSSGNLTQLLLPLYTFAFLNRSEVSAVRGAKVRRLRSIMFFTDSSLKAFPRS